MFEPDLSQSDLSLIKDQIEIINNEAPNKIKKVYNGLVGLKFFSGDFKDLKNKYVDSFKTTIQNLKKILILNSFFVKRLDHEKYVKDITDNYPLANTAIRNVKKLQMLIDLLEGFIKHLKHKGYHPTIFETYCKEKIKEFNHTIKDEKLGKAA